MLTLCLYITPCFFLISFYTTARRLFSLEISVRNVESRNCLVLDFGVSSITRVLLTPQNFLNCLPRTFNIKKRVCLLCTPISFLFWITQVSLDCILLIIQSSVTIMLILSPEVEYKGPYWHHVWPLTVPYLVLGRANPWWNRSGSSSSTALFFRPLSPCGLCHFFSNPRYLTFSHFLHLQTNQNI